MLMGKQMLLTIFVIAVALGAEMLPLSTAGRAVFPAVTTACAAVQVQIVTVTPGADVLALAVTGVTGIASGAVAAVALLHMSGAIDLHDGFPVDEVSGKIEVEAPWVHFGKTEIPAGSDRPAFVWTECLLPAADLILCPDDALADRAVVVDCDSDVVAVVFEGMPGSPA